MYQKIISHGWSISWNVIVEVNCMCGIGSICRIYTPPQHVYLHRHLCIQYVCSLRTLCYPAGSALKAFFYRCEYIFACHWYLPTVDTMTNLHLGIPSPRTKLPLRETCQIIHKPTTLYQTDLSTIVSAEVNTNRQHIILWTLSTRNRNPPGHLCIMLADFVGTSPAMS